MAPADPDRVASIFQAAVDLEGDARRRYLDHACGADATLLREVEGLLAHDRDASPSFLKGGRRPDPGVDAGAPPVIGPYECLRALGHGGQAIVWLARDRRLGRLVALKVLARLGPGTEEIVARFKREAAVASGLRHQGICAVHDAGIADGVAFIAMQYIDGETLAQRLTKREAGGTALDAAEVLETLRIVEAIARALHVAHEAGIVHRDIKPANVMIDREGQPVILDFGLARQDDSEFPTLTRTGNVFGTPAYMSPEQVSGRASRLDRRTDIWSLGVTLYEALALRRPFDAPTPERLYQAILSETPSALRQHNRALMRDLDVVVGTAMEKSLQRRYQTALALAEDIHRILEHEPIRAKPPTAWTRISRWTKRHPGLAGGLAAAFVLLVAGLVVTALLLAKARSERELSQRLAYRSAIAAAASAAELQDPAALSRHLDDAPRELRGWEWEYLRRLLERSERTITNGRELAGEIGFSPDGGSVLVADTEGVIEQRDLSAGLLVRSVRTTPPRAGPWFTAGGRRAVLLGRDDHLQMWDVEAGRRLWSIPHTNRMGRWPLTADGAHVVLAVADRPAACVLDAATGRLVREIPLARIARDVLWRGAGSPLIASMPYDFDVVDATTGSLRWSGRGALLGTAPDGARVFAIHPEARGGPSLAGYDLADGREAERYDLPARSEVPTVDLDPRGATVCAGLGSGAIVFWDRGESSPRTVVLAHASFASRVAFTPDARRLVSLAGAELKVWSPSMSASPRILATPGDNHHGFVSSPDGRRLATTRWGDVIVFDVEEGREAWTRWLTHATLGPMAFGIAGELAAAAADKRLHVLDAATGTVVRTGRHSGAEQLVWAGSRLVSGQRDGVHLIDAASLEENGFVACSSRVTALAASRDGSTIAIGLEDGRIRIQGISGTPAPREVAPSPSPCSALAFSADGRLLASGAANGAAAIWDVARGTKVSTLPGAAAAIRTLAFHPAGKAAAAGDEAGYVRIWEVASGFNLLELRSPVFKLAPQGAWWDESMLRFAERQHPIVAFEVTTRPESEERRDLVRRSRAIVTRLFGSGADIVPAADVVARISSDPTLPEPVKSTAIAIARARGDDLNRLNGHAWEAVLWPDRPAAYERALRQAREVCRQQPDDWAFLNTLALAEHRSGLHAAACETLARCEEIHRRAGRALHPSDLAILALAEHRIGKVASARARLETARSTFFAPSFNRDEETLQLIREAEAQLGVPASR
jgi:serine/threonine protein kinase/WD40 repeat protein